MSAGSSTGSNASVLPMHDKTPLSDLLEAAVQKTYHELYTMADVCVEMCSIFFVFSSRISSHPHRAFASIYSSLPGKANIERYTSNIFVERVESNDSILFYL
jgi:hypothetical protein